MNNATFVGMVGRDAELRKTASGESVSNFSIAVNTGTKAVPKTLWVDCSLWGSRAEGVSQYITKGMKLTVAGRVDLQTFQKKDGTEGSKMTLSISDLEMPVKGSSGNSGNDGLDVF
jgi:single-strand DNA-binding protein